MLVVFKRGTSMLPEETAWVAQDCDPDVKKFTKHLTRNTSAERLPEIHPMAEVQAQHGSSLGTRESDPHATARDDSSTQAAEGILAANMFSRPLGLV